MQDRVIIFALKTVSLCRQPLPHSLSVLIRVTKHVAPLLLSAECSSACCLQELTSLKEEQEDSQPHVQVLPCDTGPGPGHLRVSWGGAMPFYVLLLMLCMLLLRLTPLTVMVPGLL